MSQDQYYALKFILQEFLKLAKNQFKNDVVATVVDFMLENTIVEYKQNATDTQIPEKSVKGTDQGYLYVDIEALVTAVEQRFAPSDKKGVYVQFFFSLGINQASFLHDNTLTADAGGAPTALKNLYYASEKIGIEYKIWNWAYTHAFTPGENFKYYNNGRILPFMAQTAATTANQRRSCLFLRLRAIIQSGKFKIRRQIQLCLGGRRIRRTFFNGLRANVSVGCPYTDKQFKPANEFINFGFDIPIVDYIAGLSKNKSN